MPLCDPALPTVFQRALHRAATRGVPERWRRRPHLFRSRPVRALVLAAVFSLAASVTALADASVAGDWRADLGSDVVITMSVTPDGGWSSQTQQNKSIVRQMKGTYRQTRSGDDRGVLVFTPTQAQVKRGKVATETDHYQLSENGSLLSLTSNGDTMLFKKQPG